MKSTPDEHVRVGEEIQKLSVLQSIPNLLVEDAKGCIQKIFPKVNQGLLQGSTEYHLTASGAIRSIVEQKLIPPDQIVHNFLHSILNCVEAKDAEVSRAWFETLLDVIAILPMSIIHRDILPAAVAKSEMSRPILHRLMSCKLLGRIAKGCDIYLMKKDVFPVIQALTQDTSKEVRAAICMELPACAAILTSSADKDILPILNEFANDEEPLVKVAACQTMVDILPYSSPEVLKTMIIPLSKKMITLALFPGEDEMKVIVTKNFGKISLGFEKVISQNDKLWMLEHFCKLAQLGLPQMKFKDRVVQKHIPRRNSFTSNMHLQCRLNCAFNIPALLLFASDLDNSCITNTIYPVICDLASDPYFMVRRTIGAGIHEVTRILGHDNSLVIMEFIKLLKDETEEVLQGIVPNLKSTMESFCETKTLTPEFVDETAIELARALLKCEAEIASTYNWRLHSKFIEQLEVLPKCLPSDFIYSQFVPVIFKRLFSCRSHPCRLAMVRTLLKILRYNLKPSQRSELRSKLINELCCSSNFYDRMIFVKSCPDIIDIFSSAYFREFFFVKTMQLLEDKVANVRLMAYALLPQLKMIAKGAEKTTPKFTQMVENAVRVSGTETDRDVIESINLTCSKLEKLQNTAFKPDPRDVQKLEEEKHLASLTAGKEWKPHLPNSAPIGPIGSHMSGIGRRSSSNQVTEKRSPEFSRGPLSSSVSRMDSLRGSSAQPPGHESRFRTVAGSPGLAIRSPDPSNQSLTSNKTAGSDKSGISHPTSQPPKLPSDEDGGAVKNINNCVDVNDNFVIINESSKIPNRIAASASTGTNIPKNISKNFSSLNVVDKNNKIPVRRYQSKDFSNSRLSKSRRPSSVCSSEVLRLNGKVDSELVDSKEVLNNNGVCDNRRNSTYRRPHSMTSLLPPTSSSIAASRTSVTASVVIGNKINDGNNSDHNTPNPLISRLPIRTSTLRSPTPKRN